MKVNWSAHLQQLFSPHNELEYSAVHVRTEVGQLSRAKGFQDLDETSRRAEAAERYNTQEREWSTPQPTISAFMANSRHVISRWRGCTCLQRERGNVTEQCPMADSIIRRYTGICNALSKRVAMGRRCREPNTTIPWRYDALSCLRPSYHIKTQGFFAQE